MSVRYRDADGSEGPKSSAIVIPSLYTANPAEQSRRRGPGFLDTFVVEQEHVWLSGFTVYVVEQWGRTIPTIVVYTGNETDKIAIDVLSPSPELSKPEATLDHALRCLRFDGARPKDTHYGIIHVTALPSFRSDLNIAQIPGNPADYREKVFANIALRRLGCGGRSSLTIQCPSPPQREKFFGSFQLHGSDSVDDFIRIVLSLVQLVQHALSLYGLGPYVVDLTSSGRTSDEPDGLLCDTTVAGIHKFALDAGERLCRTEPSEGGVLSPSTLSILVTSVIALRARMNVLGSHHVPADPFVSRRRFLNVYRTFIGPMGFNERNLTIEALLAVKKNVTDHPDGFLRSRIKTTLEEVSRLTDITGDRRSLPEEETGDILTLANGLRKANWAVGVSSVHLLWTGKAKSTSNTLRIAPLMKRNKLAQDGGALDTDFTDSEADNDLISGKPLAKRSTLIAKAGRAVGAGISGAMGTAFGSTENVRLQVPHGHETSRRSELLLGAPVSDAELSRGPSPNASSVAVNETAGGIQHGSLLPKGRLRGVLAGLSYVNRTAPLSHMTAAVPQGEILLGSHTHLAPPTRPMLMHRSISTSSGARAPHHHNQDRPRKRRHTFSDVSDLDSQTVILSQRRLRLDVELCAAYFDLRAYEHHLFQLHAALVSIEKAFVAASASIDEPLAARQRDLRSLEERADRADGELDEAVTAAPKPDHISRNEYVQTLFLATVNDLEGLHETLISAVGPDGNLRKQTGSLKGQTGNRWADVAARLRTQCRVGWERIRGRSANVGVQ